MAMKQGMAGPRSWFGVVRKKLVIRAKLTAHPKKNVIIYNNTSIASTEDDARASCVDPAKDHITVATDAIKTLTADDTKAVVDKGGDEEKQVEEVKKLVDAVAVEPKLEHPTVNDQEDLAANHNTRQEKEEEEEEVGPSEKEKTAAAITIQSVFKAHLARRAFKALKGLVKLQAVARGVCVRRQARMALNCMKALARLQDRVQARQLLINVKSSNSSPGRRQL